MLVFISYNTRDGEKAKALEAALAARHPDFEWYLAPRNVAGGAYWIPRLADTIARSDVVLFLAGREIGNWQELEYHEALRLGRERGGRPRVVPIVIADQAPGLPFFAQLHQIFAADPTAPEAVEAIGRALDNSLPPDSSPAWQRFQPYKGLPALEESDAAFFFGRDDETAVVLDLMARRPHRIIALIGQSGVGKSSLARAGVLARLKSQLWPVPGGEWPAGLRDSRAFLPLVVRPGEQPLKELARAFAQLYCTKTFEFDEEAVGWARRFADGSGLHDMLRATRGRLAEALGAEPPKRFVVYLDQGEEAYTRAGPEEARRFAALIAEAAGHEAFSVLMSLRSDYYPAYQNDRAVFDASERVDVLPLRGEVLREVVRKPALTLGARFETDDMAGRVADATEREPGALPLLSDLMHEMWLHMQARSDGVLRWSDNPEIIDIAAPLRRRAEAFLADPANDEAVVRRLFMLRLAHVPEIGDPVRRRAPRAECGAEEWAVAEKLADQDWRLLTLSRAADAEPIVEVAHEQLLRRWPRLKSWLEEEREFLVWKGHVEQAAAAYAALPETERVGALLMGRSLAIASGWFDRRAGDLAPKARDFVAASRAAESTRRNAERRRQRIALSATSAGLVVAIVLAALAGWQWHVAGTKRTEAEHSLELATSTANGLIFDLVDKFRDAGLPTAVVENILDRIRNLQDQLSAGGEAPPALRRSQAVALRLISLTLLERGDKEGAAATAQQARGVAQALTATDPNNTDSQNVLSAVTNTVGDMSMERGQLDAALDAYRDSVAIVEALMKRHAATTASLVELSHGKEGIGDVLKAQNDLEDALAVYREGLTIAKTLTIQSPDLPELSRDLSLAYANVGNLLEQQNDHPGALSAYRDGLNIIKSLAAKDPGNTEWQADLSVGYGEIGDVLKSEGDLQGALAAYHDELTISKAMASKDPGNALWQGNLAASLYDIARLGDEPKTNMVEAVAILKRLEADGRLPTKQASLIGEIQAELGKLAETGITTPPAIATKQSATDTLQKGDKAYDRKDYVEAVRWYRLAADGGDAQAQGNLGRMYLFGWGVPIDYGEALQWARKAADQGNARGQTVIGVLYTYGSGVARDYAEAMRWFSKASDQGYGAAQANIGVLHANGWGVEKDYSEAMSW